MATEMRNVSVLNEQHDQLVDLRDMVARDFEVAKRNGEYIANASIVSSWLSLVDEKIEEMAVFLSGDEIRKKQRLRFSISCLKRNPETMKLISEAKELIRRGQQHDQVSYNRNLPDVRVQKHELVRSGQELPMQDRVSQVPAMKKVQNHGDYYLTDANASVIGEIKAAIKLKGNEMKMTGVWGMGGVGKTCLVQQVGYQLMEEGIFNKVLRVEVCRNPDYITMQAQIADELGFHLTMESLEERAAVLCRRLTRIDNCLVILDDVWECLQLNDLGIPIILSLDLKIILTSRNRDVLSKMKCEKIFRVDVFDDEDAWKLFKNVVGDADVDSPEINPIAKSIAHKCGGLYIALVTVAKALKGKKIEIWKDALHQFKFSSERMHQDIVPTLEYSINYLESNEAKSMLFLCSLFPESYDIPKDHLTLYVFGLGLLSSIQTLIEARDRVDFLVHYLETSTLLMDGVGHDCVRVHPIVRYAAHNISSERDFIIYSPADLELEGWPESNLADDASAISISFKSIHHFPQGLHYPNLKVLAFKCNLSSPRFPANFFEGMKSLTVLHISGMNNLSLLSIRLLRDIRTLLMDYCTFTDLSVLGELTSLEILSFYGSDITELPLQIGQLTGLQMLNLTNCNKLTRIPPDVISKLSRLEILCTNNSFMECGIRRDELTTLSHLRELEMHIPNAKYFMLNDIIILIKSLIRFKISIGSPFAKEEEDHHQSSERILKLSGNFFNDTVNVLFERADTIYLDNLKNLGEDVLKADGYRLMVCRYLKVEKCVGIETLINSSKLLRDGRFSTIESMEVIDSELKFIFLPSFVRCLVYLRKLKIEGCKKMEQIVRCESSEETTVVFRSLRSLTLALLPSLVHFSPKPEATASHQRPHLFNRVVEFPSLKVLTIYGLDQLEVICDNQISIEFFPKLRVITVVNCAKIPTIGNINPREIFSSLEELAFMSCCMSDDFVSVQQRLDLQEYGNVLPMLNALTLWGQSKLMGVWNMDSFVPQFSNLTELELWSCSTLRYVFTSTTVKQFPCLQTLRVESCSVVQVIDDGHQEASISNDAVLLPQLKSLMLNDLPHLTSFCNKSFVSKLDSLETLIITQCPQMKTFTGEIEEVEGAEIRINNTPSIAFFCDEVAFPRLVTLKLSDIDSILKIWDFDQIPTESFCLLRELVVQKCSNLEQVFSFDSWRSKMLPCLEQLIVQDCKMVREVFDLRGMNYFPLGYIKRLSLIKLPSLNHFCIEEEYPPPPPAHEIGESEIDNMNPSFQSLFSCNVAKHLVQLQVLEVVECEMDEIVSGEEDANNNYVDFFSGVHSVKLKDLPNLVRFCSNNQSMRWSSLTTLEVEGCPNLETLACVFFNPREEAVGDDATQQMTISSTSTQDPIQHELAIVTLSLHRLVKLKEIWNDDHRILVFNHLSCLTIHGNERLRTLFTPTIVGGLSQLRDLIVDSCKMMEVIISKERSGTRTEAAAIRTIALPQLKTIELKHLPELESFLTGDYNYMLEFPLLDHVRVEECPLLQFFSPEKIDAPNLTTVHTGDNQTEWKGDLESTIGHLFKGEVQFSETEELHVIDPDKLFEILDIKLHYKAFRRLKLLHVECCDEELREFLSRLIFRFQELAKLSVGNCNSLEQLFNFEELIFGDQDKIFTKLEELKLWNLPRLMCIWNKEMGRYVSLKNLKRVDIYQCGHLLNLFSPSIARDLQQLQELKICDCDMMEEVVVAETEGGNDDFQAIFLPQLQLLELIGLSNLKTFHSGNCAFELPHLHTLRIERCPRLKSLTPGFITTPKSTDIDGMSNNKMVGFPRLNQLYLKSLNDFEEIWRESVTGESLTELQIVEIDDCGKLLNVIPHDVWPRLKKLEKLAIKNCPSLRKIFDLEVQIINVERVGSDVFTRLNESISTNLADLVPDGLIAVFKNLQVLKLSDSYRLNNLFSTSIARSFMEFKGHPHPTRLHIIEEHSMKGKERDKIGSEFLPKLDFLDLDLSSLTLNKCPELNILFSEIQCTNHLPAPRQPLFEQVSSFERLEELHLVHLGYFEQIWHDEFPITSFCKLRVLSIEKGEKLLKIIPSHALVNLLELEKLYVQNCDSLKEIFDLDGITEIITEELHPKLSVLVLSHLPDMVGIYNKEPIGIPTFRNLRSLRIIHCNSLMSIFSASAARGLQQLQEFKVFGCKKMQVVIVDDEKDVKENMIFPDLRCLVLKNLPQLASFYRGMNTIKWPVLKEVRIKAVPVMEMFALGSQETPQLTAIYVTFLEKCWKGNLNKTIKFLHENKKWNAATKMVVREYESTSSHGQIQTTSQSWDKMKHFPSTFKINGSMALEPNKDKGKEIMEDP